MKPLQLEFQAFGPYVEYEAIDFAKLKEKGLFLICGETGSGKTMILDAMTYALYGKSSGHTRDVFENMRSTSADDTTPTFVKFIFETAGDKYLFERRLEKRRKNFAASYNMMKMDEEGNWQVLLENPKEKDLNNKAVSLIGLEYDQFRQVIVLPQGQFEKLLTSGSDEKEKILTNIFGEDKWQSIAEKIYEEAADRKERFRQVKDKIVNSLLEEGCDSVEGLLEIIDQKKDELNKLEIEYKEASYEERIQILQRLVILQEKYATLHKEHLRRTEELSDAVQNVERYTKKYDESIKKLEEHLQSSSIIEDIKKEITTLELKREDYATIDGAQKEYENRLKELNKAKKDEEQAQKACVDIEKQIAIAKNKYSLCLNEYEIILNAYISGISGVLASELKDGVACPVCGSIEHPNPAIVNDEVPDKDDVDNKKLELDDKNEDLNSCIEKQKAIVDDFGEKKEITHKAQNSVVLAESELLSKKANMYKNISSLEELNITIKEKENQVESFAEKTKELEEDEKSYREKLTEIKSKIEVIKSEIDKCADAMEKADSELKEELVRRGLNDSEEISELIREYQEQIKDYSNKKGVISSQLDRLLSKHEMLLKDSKGLEEKLKTAEEDFLFAKRLRGDSGTGLQRYVLGIMFSSVVSAANKMLELVHDGRYRLYRSDDKAYGSNKKGLELKVIDKYSGDPDGRFVNTLSGGEKFLASLALSIGMSTIAQRSGIRIEALFIDEGFGSLDDNSIVDAMNVLSSIQEANGLVGIISHVQILEDRIPTKLIVNKLEGRSTITQSIG